MITLHKVSRRVADTSNAVPVATLRIAAWKNATARSTSGQIRQQDDAPTVNRRGLRKGEGRT